MQKSGDAVRVNVQLIKAANDSHLWADTFDRKLTDIFSVESEVAKAIADQLRAKLTGQEEQVIAAKTDRQYRGLRCLPARASGGAAGMVFRRRNLRRSYAASVRLDPKFVAAWARPGAHRLLMVFTRHRRDTRATRRRQAPSTLRSNCKSDSTDTLLSARGVLMTIGAPRYPKAKDLFAQVRNRLPNSGEVPSALALVARRQGLWDESLNYSDQALTFDPRNPQLLADRYFLDLCNHPPIRRCSKTVTVC